MRFGMYVLHRHINVDINVNMNKYAVYIYRVIYICPEPCGRASPETLNLPCLRSPPGSLGKRTIEVRA